MTSEQADGLLTEYERIQEDAEDSLCDDGHDHGRLEAMSEIESRLKDGGYRVAFRHGIDSNAVALGIADDGDTGNYFLVEA